VKDTLQEKIEQAIAYVRISLPHLASALAVLDFSLDQRVQTAAITSSGRVLIDPMFVEDLSVRELGFVFAHELYHALYGVFDRFSQDQDANEAWLVNVAHDFIVNDLLVQHLSLDHEPVCDEYGFVVSDRWTEVPEGALLWRNYSADFKRLTGKTQPPLDEYTLESLVLELKGLKKRAMSFDALGGTGLPLGALGGSSDGPFDSLKREAFPEGGYVCRDASGMDPSPARQKPLRDSDGPLGYPVGAQEFGALLRSRATDEFLSEVEEREMFPDETELERRARRERFEIELELGNDEFRKAVSQLAGEGGHAPGGGTALVKAFVGAYKLPWEAALQKSIDDFAYTERTWARASRRSGDRSDVVLPGHARVGYQLNIVADTSGSMVAILPMVLGLIQTFGRSAGLSVVRIVQCDSEVQSDDVVKIDEMASLEMKGMGGGMDPPGMLRMAEDPDVERVLVLTDGYIEIPEEKDVPYDVTWCLLTEGGLTDHFNPPYGRVIGIPIDDFLKEGEIMGGEIMGGLKL